MTEQQQRAMDRLDELADKLRRYGEGRHPPTIPCHVLRDWAVTVERAVDEIAGVETDD